MRITDDLSCDVFTVANLAVSGVLGTAATTVDKYATLYLNQTTIGITITLPAPTDTTPGRRLRIYHNGTNPCILQSSGGVFKQLTQGEWIELEWTNGAGWRFSLSLTKSPFVQRITATGTYTPTLGMVYAIVEVQGSGGGGGGVAASAINTGRISGGGGGGGYVKALLTAGQIGASQLVTIGAGGAGAAAGDNAGAAGTNTTFGALLTANSGAGGAAGASSATIQGRQGSAGGGFAVNVGVDLGSSNGFASSPAYLSVQAGAFFVVMQAKGGDAAFAKAAGSFTQLLGTPVGSGSALTPLAANLGIGAQGQFNSNTVAFAGQAGSSGIVVVTEYF